MISSNNNNNSNINKFGYFISCWDNNGFITLNGF